ncbi:MAG: DUF2169 domain-containing protein [Minicystis sp.]
MDVTSTGPFSVGSLLWQRLSSRVLTVVAKATFTLLPGDAAIAEEQEPVNPEDSHLEDDPARSMQAPSDLVPFKGRADVVLVGYAFAPRGEPVRSLVVRLIVGDVDKSIEVVGDRAWALDGSLREGPRFARMALRWERAAGGPDTINPIGVSESAPPDTYGNAPLPNLQPVGFVPSRRGEAIAPVGLGPVSRTWPLRRERLGRLAPPDRMDGPLPAELDPSYFNCAPRDQQSERLRDNERLVLENLHPQHPRLVTSLPGLHPRAFADRGDGQPQEIPMVCDTLWIDTGRGICTLTWRGYVESPPNDGRVVVLAEGAGRTIDWSEIQSRPRPSQAPPPAPAAARRPSPKTMPFMAAAGPQEAALPFQPSSGATPSAAASRLASMTPSAPRPASGDPLSETRSDEDSETTQDALPQWMQGRGAPPSGATIATVPAALTAAAAPMPFTAAPAPFPAAPAPVPPAPVPPAPVTPMPFAATPAPVPPAPLAVAPPSPVIAPPSPIIAPPSPVIAPPSPVMAPPSPVIAPPPIVPSLSATGAGSASSPWASGPSITAAAAAVASIPPVTPAPSVARPSNVVTGPPAPVAPSATAVTSGAAAASDAAAAQARTPAPAPAPAKNKAAEKAAEKNARPVTEVLDLIWYDERNVQRVRTRWEELVTELDFEPEDPGEDLGGEDPEKAKARHHVFGVMSDGEVVDASGVARVVIEAVGRRGRFTPPLVLVGGEIRFPFDEVETLRATITAITPLAGNDKKLRESIDTMSDLLKTPYLQGGAGVVEKLTQQLRAEFRETSRGLPAGYLDGHVERFLLEQRRYAVRKVFGGEFIRALLAGPSKDDAPIPVYLPKQLEQTLPMVVTLRARLIAEAHLQQDPYDTSPYALRAIALGRSLPIDGLRPPT